MPARRSETERMGMWVARAPIGDLAIAVVAALCVVVFAVLAAVAVGSPEKKAPSNTHFDAGLIIGDAAFYDPDAMTAAQIQRFLQQRDCTPQGNVPCLKDYRVDTPDEPTQYAHCAAMRGEHDEAASSIIARIAQACRISPKVLLVLLQKEQSLLTHPTVYGYQRATGYGCPDTAGCDARYFGFFNQLYNAAWQFREYTVGGSSWRYHVGRVRIQYHPNAACGGSVVDIRTQATANLYNYTPYQPSPQTVRHPDVVTPCSTYGNLNFWNLYTTWFGSPLTQPFPAQYAPCLNLVGGARCFIDPKTGL